MAHQMGPGWWPGFAALISKGAQKRALPELIPGVRDEGDGPLCQAFDSFSLSGESAATVRPMIVVVLAE